MKLKDEGEKEKPKCFMLLITLFRILLIQLIAMETVSKNQFFSFVSVVHK